MICGKRLLFGSLIIVVATAGAIGWWLFGWSSEITGWPGRVEIISKRRWGKILEVAIDRNGDGSVDGRTFYESNRPYHPGVSVLCGQRGTGSWADRNFDGRWDMWRTTDSEDSCLHEVEIDTDFDGAPDWFIRCSGEELLRVHDAVDAFNRGRTDLVCDNVLPRDRYITLLVHQYDCRALPGFWHRAVRREFDEGWDRETAELLAAGKLPAESVRWPQEQQDQMKLLIEEGLAEEEAEEAIRDRYWMDTWDGKPPEDYVAPMGVD